jgi:hypothetical protein
MIIKEREGQKPMQRVLWCLDLASATDLYYAGRRYGAFGWINGFDDPPGLISPF